jgi:hypothetical protein
MERSTQTAGCSTLRAKQGFFTKQGSHKSYLHDLQWNQGEGGTCCKVSIPTHCMCHHLQPSGAPCQRASRPIVYINTCSHLSLNGKRTRCTCTDKARWIQQMVHWHETRLLEKQG